MTDNTSTYDFRPYRGRKVLITGGLGFIGSNLARRLVSLGSRTTIIDALIPTEGGNPENVEDIAADVDVRVMDLRSLSSEPQLVSGQETIFNLAGSVSHLDSMASPVVDMQLNCESHLGLLEACRRSNPEARIVYTGTRAQYGRPQYFPVDEAHPQQPLDINGVNKMTGEAYHFIYARAYGIPVCSLRLTNTYGPRQPMKDARHGFIAWMTRLALEGRCIPVYGDGLQRRDLNYVDDVVDAILLAGLSSGADGEVFNIGSNRPVAILDIASQLSDLTGGAGYHLVPFPGGEKNIEIGDYYADYSKAARVLGWQPRVSLEDGLRLTVSFFRQAGWRPGETA